ncbi:hypothetical protein OG894_41050 [Streptomyces sp. NBC_01724]|uniref:hypothetical protein n=1 Tax=unclassified Streptomyces TaxID=2593676 RepID=UPI0028C401D4|nr:MULTISPECIES: hypothetical protein [unclassified Streptomyces]WNO62482.1 hypothetical protein RPQ02_01060 [Streptomyces sp. AM2-3-1]
MRIRRLAGAMALATLTASVTLLAGPSPAQAADSIVLPVVSHWQTLADSHHVYVSSPGDNAVVATDHTGQVIKTVEGLDGARGMTLATDESTLYVALPEADAIAEIDTNTLTEVRRIPTGTDTEPENLALAGGKLYFSYQATPFNGGIGSISIADADPVVGLDDDPQWYSKPRLASSPAAPDRLVAADSEGSLGMRVYDVGSGNAQEIAYTEEVGSVEDLAVTPDGGSVITARGGTYYHQQWRLSDLTEEAQYDTGPYPNAVAIAPDGTVAAGVSASGEWDIFVYRRGETTPLRTIDLSYGGLELVRRGVAWAPDGSKLFGTRFTRTHEVVLDIITDVRKANSNITLTAPAAQPLGETVTVHGKLTSLVAFPKRKVVTITRNDAQIATVKVKADGTFTFTDIPPLAGYPTYIATYAGDTDHASGTGTVQVEITD